ncbi:hypothetical protein LY76DRAFT_399687 [Colletotrichum caudatum]|nr:hypothetical protein LY76DRAFT_399687 [Colletotrichum caudatum]
MRLNQHSGLDAWGLWNLIHHGLPTLERLVYIFVSIQRTYPQTLNAMQHTRVYGRNPASIRQIINAHEMKPDEYFPIPDIMLVHLAASAPPHHSQTLGYGRWPLDYHAHINLHRSPNDSHALQLYTDTVHADRRKSWAATVRAILAFSRTTKPPSFAWSLKFAKIA